MAEIYGNQQPDNMRGNQTASLGTEFERSIERNMPQEAAGDRPADTTTAAREGAAALKQKAGEELGSVKQAAERGVGPAVAREVDVVERERRRGRLGRGWRPTREDQGRREKAPGSHAISAGPSGP